MSKLGDKIRKSRESSVDVRTHKFLISRPTELDMLEFRAGLNPRQLMRFIRGWEGVTEGDIIPNGDPHPLDYDPDACTEWLTDDAELFNEVITAIVESFTAHKEATRSATKN